MSTLMDKMLGAAEDWLRRHYQTKPHEQLAPAWLGLTSDNQVICVLATNMRGDRDKDDIADIVRSEFVKHQVVAYAFITEMWHSQIAYAAVNETPRRLLRPSEQPDREERALVSANDGTIETTRAFFMRRERGAVVELIPDPQLSHTVEVKHTQGRFANLLSA